jgi:hypothetical protein
VSGETREPIVYLLRFIITDKAKGKVGCVGINERITWVCVCHGLYYDLTE